MSPGTEEWLQQAAKRTNLPKGALLEALADESIRIRRFPGISFRGPEHDRRAWVVGTGLDVWEIVEGHDEMGREQLLHDSTLSTRAVDLALTYRDRYPQEIDDAIQENRQRIDYWQHRYPGVLITTAE